MNMRKIILAGGGIYLLVFLAILGFIYVRRQSAARANAKTEVALLATSTESPEPTQPLPTTPPTPTEVVHTPTPSTTPFSEESEDPNPSPTPTSTSTRQPPATMTPTRMNEPTASRTSTVPAEGVQTETPTSTEVPSTTPVPSPTPMASATPSNASIEGRLTYQGEVVSSQIELRLEDRLNNLIAQTNTDMQGRYKFEYLPPNPDGYMVVFALEWNNQITLEGSISWGWFGPVIVSGGQSVVMPDFELSLNGFGQQSPPPEARVSISTISSATPLQFAWHPYPLAQAYWIDLTSGDDQQLIWTSPNVAGTSVNFEGLLMDGSQIQAGEYWWGVGAQAPLEGYQLTVYSFLTLLNVEP